MSIQKILLVCIIMFAFISCERKDEDSSDRTKQENPVSAAPEAETPPSIELDERPARPNRKGTADIAFFYMETCPSCDEYILADRLKEQLQNAAKRGHLPWKTINLITTNVLTQQQVDQLKSYIESHDYPDVSLSLPVIFVNDEIVVGYEEIEKLIEGLIAF